jgi:putative chitinase
MKTVEEWRRVLLAAGVSPATAGTWSKVFAAVIGDDTFSKGMEEVDDFLGQVLHESSMLERLEENLNYSAPRMCKVWPARFPTLEAAEPYARNPIHLANKVYGGRLGNVEPNDGWNYRGRGLLQVTGRDNYTAVGQAIGVDLEECPDLLAEPEYALRASIAWWEGHVPDSVMGDIVRVTKRVNGGTVGLADRQHLTDEAREALG